MYLFMKGFHRSCQSGVRAKTRRGKKRERKVDRQADRKERNTNRKMKGEKRKVWVGRVMDRQDCVKPVFPPFTNLRPQAVVTLISNPLSILSLGRWDVFGTQHNTLAGKLRTSRPLKLREPL